MAEDQVYQAASQYAADTATLVMKSAIAGLTLGMDGVKMPLTDHVAAAASAAVALERSGGASVESTFTEGTQDWRTLHGAIARTIPDSGRPDGHFPDGEGLVAHLLSDVSVQTHSQAILAARDDPARADRLEVADRHVMEAVGDGGDIEDLVRRRASGSYHELTPDQQEDVAESIRKRDMMSPALLREIDAAERAASMTASTALMPDEQVTMPTVTREGMERAQEIAERRSRPLDDTEIAVAAHYRSFPDPLDEAGKIARGMAISADERPSGPPLAIAIGIERVRLVIQDAQARVSDGTSSESDRHLAAGRGHQDDHPIADHGVDIHPVNRARIARNVLDIHQECVTRMQGINAAQSRDSGIGRA